MSAYLELEFKAAAVRMITLAISIVTVVSQLIGCSHQANTSGKNNNRFTNANEISECRVSFLVLDDKGPFAEVCMEEKAQIENAILAPLRNAKYEAHPADYVILGVLKIVGEDGSRDDMVLFLPWGHFKRNDNKYYVTDFSKLRLDCLETLREAVQHPRLWESGSSAEKE